MTGERCAACGNSTVVQTARGAGCVSCGAGITSVFGRRVARFTPKGRKRHQHRWNYLGTTTETGVTARKEQCEVCPVTRLVEV